MNDQALWSLFQPLYADIVEDDNLYVKKPLLAHYTSLDALEKILTSEEVWFSNPLFMNDIEEVRFGILHGASALRSSGAIRKALTTDTRHKHFADSLDYAIEYFEREHLFDT